MASQSEGASPPKRAKRLSLYELSTMERPEGAYPKDYMDKVISEIELRLKITEENLSIQKSIKDNKPPELDVKDLNPKHKEFLAKLPDPGDFLLQVKDFIDYMVVKDEFDKIEERKSLERIKYLKMDMRTLLETEYEFVEPV